MGTCRAEATVPSTGGPLSTSVVGLVMCQGVGVESLEEVGVEETIRVVEPEAVDIWAEGAGAGGLDWCNRIMKLRIHEGHTFWNVVEFWYMLLARCILEVSSQMSCIVWIGEVEGRLLQEYPQ